MTRPRVDPGVGPQDGAPPAMRVPPRLRYHFHGPGLVYTTVTIVLALGAINSQNNLLFWALGLALSGLVASGMVSGASLARIRITRLALPPAAVGEPVRVRYAISNTSRFVPAFGLTITEVAAPDGPGGAAAEFGPVRAFVLHVGPGATVEAEALVVPRRRGAYPLAEIRASSTFPFGLARKSVTLVQPAVALVRPARLTLSAAALAALAAGASGRRGARPSDDHDFYGLREFDAADPPGKVAWKVSARMDRPVVRHEPPRGAQRLWLLVDRSHAAAPEQADGFELALALAGSLIREAAARGLAAGLAIPSAQVLRAPRPGVRHADDMLDQLAMVRLDPAEAGVRFRSAPPALRNDTAIVIHSCAAHQAPGPRGAVRMSVSEIGRYVDGPLPAIGTGTPGSAAA